MQILKSLASACWRIRGSSSPTMNTRCDGGPDPLSHSTVCVLTSALGRAEGVGHTAVELDVVVNGVEVVGSEAGGVRTGRF